MRLINRAIIQALNAARKDMGSARAVALKSGISSMQVSRWLRGRGEVIQEDTYRKLLPVIKPYLREQVYAPDYPGDAFSEFNLTEEESDLIAYLRSAKGRRDKGLLLLKIDRLKNGSYEADETSALDDDAISLGEAAEADPNSSDYRSD